MLDIKQNIKILEIDKKELFFNSGKLAYNIYKEGHIQDERLKDIFKEIDKCNEEISRLNKQLEDAAATAQTAKICPKCGRTNNPNAKFCAGCGNVMADMTPPAPVSGKICPKCGTRNDDIAKFCFRCGGTFPMVHTPVPTPAPIVTPEESPAVVPEAPVIVPETEDTPVVVPETADEPVNASEPERAPEEEIITDSAEEIENTEPIVNSNDPIICHNCGNSNSPGANFCGGCGKLLTK